jgi:ATP-dependent helicase HrpB
MTALPIDSHLPEIVATLRDSKAIVLTAPPGAGKTTRIPRALYDAGFADQGEILILEPRRLAARMAAWRVALEFGESPGQTVGYSIRFENVGGPKTRIRFLTEAILARRIVQNPRLDGIAVVILDEFHERHLATDLALAFLKRLQEQNSKPKLVVMSATMNAGAVSSYLSNAPVLSVAEAPFQLEIEHEAKTLDRPLHDKVAAAVSRLLRSGLQGDILVFLPGAAEIRRALEALQPAARLSGLSLHPLHGDLPSSEQLQAMEPAGRTKIILATNVAETSITIPGIAAVIDSGLARVAGHSPWSGFPTLTTAKISKSSANQRAGRAGRTQAGRVVRLYTRADFESRAEYEIPEIRRADLAETVLLLHGAGISNAGDFPWFDPPASAAIEAAEALLRKLGAVGDDGAISDSGRRMLRLPVHPRLGRLILEGEKLHASDEATLLAALLSERDIRLDARARLKDNTRIVRAGASGSSDLLDLLDNFRKAEEARFAEDPVRALGLDARAVQSVRRAQRQLRHILGGGSASAAAPATDQAEEAVLIAVLAAFPDRVARRRTAASRELLLSGGGSARLSPLSVVHDPMFLVAVDAEERSEKASPRAANPVIHLASAIEVEWLAGLFPESISQKVALTWNERAGRVDEIRRTSYGQISLEETVRTAKPSEEATQLLVSAVFNRKLSIFSDADSLPSFRERMRLLAACFPQENFPLFGEDMIRAAVERVCRGKSRLDEVAALPLVTSLMENLTERQRALLRREAPERVSLKSGRSVRIHYEPGSPPWIESRLQDFFGTYTTPAICAGQVGLTLHLLAPNGRAVQVTKDLTGFWENHYPAIRRELQRRYPKHAWPEPASLKRMKN